MGGGPPASALAHGGTSLVPCCKKDNHRLPPKPHWGVGGKGELCALICSVPGHWVWDVTWQIPLQFHHSLWVSLHGAVSNKMRHSHPPLQCWGPLSTLCPTGCITAGFWQRGVTHRCGELTSGCLCPQSWPLIMAPPETPPPASHLRMEWGVSQGLGSPQAFGPIQPLAPVDPVCAGHGELCHCITHLASAAIPALPCAKPGSSCTRGSSNGRSGLYG